MNWNWFLLFHCFLFTFLAHRKSTTKAIILIVQLPNKMQVWTWYCNEIRLNKSKGKINDKNLRSFLLHSNFSCSNCCCNSLSDTIFNKIIYFCSWLKFVFFDFTSSNWNAKCSIDVEISSGTEEIKIELKSISLVAYFLLQKYTKRRNIEMNEIGNWYDMRIWSRCEHTRNKIQKLTSKFNWDLSMTTRKKRIWTFQWKNRNQMSFMKSSEMK